MDILYTNIRSKTILKTNNCSYIIILSKREKWDMLKDRGTKKKWVAIMLPEHVAGVKEVIVRNNKIEKPGTRRR